MQAMIGSCKAFIRATELKIILEIIKILAFCILPWSLEADSWNNVLA